MAFPSPPNHFGQLGQQFGYPGQFYGAAEVPTEMMAYQQLIDDQTRRKQPETGFFRRQPQRLNITAVLISLFVPWFVFCFVTYLLTFETHHEHPMTMYVLIGLASWVVFFFMAMAIMQERKISNLDTFGTPVQPKWYLFLFITSLASLLFGVLVGMTIYTSYSRPFYDLIKLGRYTEVNPATMHGEQVMDGGSLVFKDGTTLQKSLAFGFQNNKIYCVAPLSFTDLPLNTYDFWAVGIDCCTGNEGSFDCIMPNATIRSGVRVMEDENREWYRLAVQQAVSYHGIEANHPIFLHWVADADEEVNLYIKTAKRYFFGSMVGTYGAQIIAVALLVLRSSSTVFSSDRLCVLRSVGLEREDT
eukprot:CAMPEP_0194487850 /NCGR_PEP_ID=MMETSP0253-20130528/7999_1 /TAXON_ID=2966 /ORGANISM="Noctiluca scintillans" /LENGTH=358 /DNA_ID=CAMNT_0039328139 /DNA_START=59 /DNA_END=1136 /DNA_ORIENTATION=-